MAELQHSQIKAKLIEGVVGLIEMNDVRTQAKDEMERHALSRATAATALCMASNIDIKHAVTALVDGGRDNGLDAIYYESQSRTLFMVQSKWNTSHSGSIDSAAVLKFLQGVQDLVSLKKDRFNQKVKDRWPVIEDCLTRLTSVRLIIAYSGSTNIDADIQKNIDEFVQSQNDTSDLFFSEIINQRQLFQHFLQEAAPPQIDLTIRLAHYGLIEAPLRAVYGQIQATDVAEWYRKFGNNLFSRNIRHFLGIRSDVNSAISKTLTEDAGSFWYFNNGITIMVDRYSKQAFGGNDRSVGLFDCNNISIVNGAQTAGTIGRMLNDENSVAILLARIIAVEDPESDVGKRITRASNTQNRIDARNFVALDPEQERIRSELLISKVEYEYREGEPIEAMSDGFEFIEAITILACASNEISFVAMAKGYVGGLYADLEVSPYKALFNGGTLSKRLWSLVRLSRRIDAAIRSHHSPDQAVERGVVVHGNRLLLHLILRKLGANYDVSVSDEISKAAIEEVSQQILERIKAVLESDYKDAYLAPLFKNVGKCTNIRGRVEAKAE